MASWYVAHVFANYFEMVPVAPIVTGIAVVFTFLLLLLIFIIVIIIIIIIIIIEKGANKQGFIKRDLPSWKGKAGHEI
jgi:hypothetical protein